MQNWFFTQQLDEDTYVISESKHWADTHCYLLLGKNKGLLIDSGLGVADISNVVNSLYNDYCKRNSIDNLPIEVIATHAHFDHIGGHGAFANRYVHKNEYDWLNIANPTSLSYVKRAITLRPCDFPVNFNKDNLVLFIGSAKIVAEGDVIDLGGRRVSIIDTPGHTPGHMSFYEENRGYLYAGDVAYKGILACHYPYSDPMLFYKSIKKLCNFNVTQLLPSHNCMDIKPYLLHEILEGFEVILKKGKLFRGGGRHEFSSFKIYL